METRDVVNGVSMRMGEYKHEEDHIELQYIRP